MIQGLKELANIDIPGDIASEGKENLLSVVPNCYSITETRLFLIEKLKELKVECAPPLTTARLLDKVLWWIVFLLYMAAIPPFLFCFCQVLK